MTIITVLVVYFVAMMCIGIYFSRGLKTGDDFNVAGRNQHWIWVFAGFVAIQTGAGATITMTGLTYTVGGAAIWWQVSNGIVFWLYGLTVTKYFRRARCATISEYMFDHFGRRTRFLTDILMPLVGTAGAAAQVAGMAAILSALTPLSYDMSAIIGMGVCMIYIFLGGLKAVQATDLVQVILVVGAIVATFIMCTQKLGPLNTLNTETLGDNARWIWSDFIGSNQKSFMWFICMTISWYVSRVGAQACFMQNASARNERYAVITQRWGGFVPIILGVLTVWLGQYAQIYLENAKPDSVLPTMINEMLPPIVAGILVAGLAAACMSTADANLNAVSSSLNEIAKYWFKMDEKYSLRFSRIGIVVFGVVAVLLVIRLRSIYNLLMLLFDLSAPYVAQMHAPILYKRCTEGAAFWTFLIGIPTVFIYRYCFPAAAANIMPVAFTLAVCVVCMVVISEVQRATGKFKPMIMLDYEAIHAGKDNK